MASRDYLKHVVSTSETTNSTVGDEYFNPSSNRLFKRLAVNGTSVRWVEQQQSIEFQASGSTVATAPRFINFPGATLTFNTTTGALDIQSSGIPGGVNTNIQFNNSGAFAGSGNLTWNGSLLNVTGRIETNGSRVVDYKNATAQWAMSGGGLVTWTGASILWNTRVICIPVENNEMGSSGHFDITCPTSGTVVYYNSVNVTTTLTATAAGIPMAAWEALYYEVTEGMSSAFDQTRFRVVNYQNTTWRPSTGWLLIAAVNGDGTNIGHIKWIPGQVNLPTTGATVTYNTGTGVSSWAAGTGTVTAVSVASANGFAGTSSGGATPALTLTTSITGLLKGNGTAISAATAGTDYQTAQSVTGIVKSSGTTRSAATAGTDYLAPPTGTALLKANSGGALANAVAGTDYQTAQSVTGIVKSSGTTRSAAVAGTDYQSPIGTISGIAKGNGANALTAATAGTDYVAPSGTFFIGTTSIAHNRASASLSMTGVNIDGSAVTLATFDDRVKAPSDDPAGALRFGFTSFANNNTAPYADYLHLRSYSDGTGGNENLLMIRKDAIGIRLWQQAWGSATAYATYKDVAFTDGTIAVATTVTTTASTTNSAFKIPMVNTTGVATGNFGLLLDSSAATEFTYNPSTNIMTVGGVDGAGIGSSSVNAAVTAAGTTQGTAFAIATERVNVTTATANQGVRLPYRIAGHRIIIRNATAVTIKVYPNTSAQINSLGTNVGFDLIAGTTLEYICFSATLWATLSSTYA